MTTTPSISLTAIHTLTPDSRAIFTLLKLIPKESILSKRRLFARQLQEITVTISSSVTSTTENKKKECSWHLEFTQAKLWHLLSSNISLTICWATLQSRRSWEKISSSKLSLCSILMELLWEIIDATWAKWIWTVNGLTPQKKHIRRFFMLNNW